MKNSFFQSTYQRPQLCKGSLPTLNLGRPEKCEKSQRSSRKRKTEDVNATDSSKKERKDLGDAEENKVASEESASAIKGNLDNLNNDTDIFDTEPSNRSADLFDKIFKNEPSIFVPVSWVNINCSWGKNNDPAITFQKQIGRVGKNGHAESVCQKEITLDKTITLLIKFNGVYVDHKEFGIETNELSSVENLEQVIKVIDERKIYQGCSEIPRASVNNHLLSSFSYVDKIDCLRHNQCHLLLPLDLKEQNVSCTACKSVKAVLKKKLFVDSVTAIPIIEK